MKKNLLILALIFAVFAQAAAQRYGTRSAKISFFSDAPLEKIEAVNSSGYGVIDAATKRVQFGVLIKGFQFKKALMQEHFNENYMESSQFPKATFKGAIVEGDPDFFHGGNYKIKVKGDLTIHGVTHEVEVPGTISMSKAGAKIKAVFDVKVADYNIKIPSVVKGKIAENVKITVDALLPMLSRK